MAAPARRLADERRNRFRTDIPLRLLSLVPIIGTGGQRRLCRRYGPAACRCGKPQGYPCSPCFPGERRGRTERASGRRVGGIAGRRGGERHGRGRLRVRRLRQGPRPERHLRARSHGPPQSAGRGCGRFVRRRHHRDDDARPQLMLARLVGLVRADVDRQIGWAKGEIRRQTRYAALTAGFAIAGALALLGAIVVGLIALYTFIEIHHGPFVALGVVGGGLAVLGLLLLALALFRSRPRPEAPPRLESAQLATLLSALTEEGVGAAASSSEPAKAATNTRQRLSRQALLGVLALAAVAGILIGRRL